MNESEWAVMVSKADKLASLVYKLLKTHHCNNDCSLLKNTLRMMFLKIDEHYEKTMEYFSHI